MTVLNIIIIIKERKQKMHKNTTKTEAQNKQDKLKNAVNSIPKDNQNQNHNIKKESLGPNTNR